MVRLVKGRFDMNFRKTILIGLAAALFAVLAWQFMAARETQQRAVIKVPMLTAQAVAGEKAFNANCITCHGANAGGSDKGPPLVHQIYEPGHHADMSFVLAAKRGVRAHHWKFGNMPPQPDVSDAEIAAIIRYVRELQVANGITHSGRN